MNHLLVFTRGEIYLSVQHRRTPDQKAETVASSSSSGPVVEKSTDYSTRVGGCDSEETADSSFMVRESLERAREGSSNIPWRSRRSSSQ